MKANPAKPNQTQRVSSEILDRMPPQSIEAERQVIGSILLLPRCLDEVAQIVQQDDFYADAHQKLFGHLLAMHDDARRIDSALLRERLKAHGDYEAIGCTAYLAECAQSVPHAGHAVHYAAIIAEKARLRAIVHAATDMLREAWDPAATAKEVLEAAEVALSEIRTHDATQEVITAEQAAIEFFDRLDAAKARKTHGGIGTGIQRFDEVVGGLFDGEMTILAARPSVGKTALAGSISEHNSSLGRLVYFVSLEMTPVELAGRTICALSDVSGRVIRTGDISDEESAALAKGANEFATRPLRIDCRSAMKVYDIRRTARRLKREGLKLVIIDYIQLITPRDRRDVREQQVAEISRALKEMAKELKIPVLVLAQLNRSADQQDRPTKGTLRESGALEQDADNVLLLHRPDGGIFDWEESQEDGKRKKVQVRRPWPAELICDKQRNGETGTFKLDWQPGITRFSCWDSKIEHHEGYAPEFGEFGHGGDF